jgi:polyisoprenoid-binding protein YceI
MFRKLLIATIALSSLSAFAAPTKINIDPAGSKITYLGKKVTGEHAGEIKLSSGHLSFEKDLLVGGEFVIDMTTINNTDIADAEYKKKFVDHMNSDDFFSTAKNKTAKLVITKAEKLKDNNYKITADLTVKGKTAPVTFDAIATKTAANGVVKFDRTTYDVKYGSGKFFQNLGDKMINDEVQLSVALAAKK